MQDGEMMDDYESLTFREDKKEVNKKVEIEEIFELTERKPVKLGSDLKIG